MKSERMNILVLSSRHVRKLVMFVRSRKYFESDSREINHEKYRQDWKREIISAMASEVDGAVGTYASF